MSKYKDRHRVLGETRFFRVERNGGQIWIYDKVNGGRIHISKAYWTITMSVTPGLEIKSKVVNGKVHYVEMSAPSRK